MMIKLLFLLLIFGLIDALQVEEFDFKFREIKKGRMKSHFLVGTIEFSQPIMLNVSGEYTPLQKIPYIRWPLISQALVRDIQVAAPELNCFKGDGKSAQDWTGNLISPNIVEEYGEAKQKFDDIPPLVSVFGEVGESSDTLRMLFGQNGRKNLVADPKKLNIIWLIKVETKERGKNIIKFSVKTLKDEYKEFIENGQCVIGYENLDIKSTVDESSSSDNDESDQSSSNCNYESLGTEVEDLITFLGKLEFNGSEKRKDLKNLQSELLSFKSTSTWAQCIKDTKPKFVPAKTQNSKVTQSTKVVKKTCDYKELSAVILKFRNIIEKLGGSATVEDLQNLEDELNILRGSDAWYACQDLLQKSMVEGPVNVTEKASKRCTYELGTLDYAIDPCCNSTIAFYDQCCAPRDRTVVVQRLSSVNSEILAKQCRIDEQTFPKLYGSLVNYINVNRRIENPEYGCEADTLRTLGTASKDYSEIFARYTRFWSQCENEVLGGKSCEKDDDCYTMCVQADNMNSTCFVPHSDKSTYMARCFLDKMDPKLKSSLLRVWNSAAGTDEVFLSKMKNVTSYKRCDGPEGYLYNGGWYISKDNPGYQPTNFSTIYSDIRDGLYISCTVKGSSYDKENNGCFYVDPSKTGCLSDKLCNWKRWDGTYSSCETDVLGNGGKFCGECFGGDTCVDKTERGGCALVLDGFESEMQYVSNDSAKWKRLSDECENAGGTLWQINANDGKPRPAYCFSNDESLNSKEKCLEECISKINPKSNQVCARQIDNPSEANKGSKRFKLDDRWYEVGEDDKCEESNTGFSFVSKLGEDSKYSMCAKSYCYDVDKNQTACYGLIPQRINLNTRSNSCNNNGKNPKCDDNELPNNFDIFPKKPKKIIPKGLLDKIINGNGNFNDLATLELVFDESLNDGGLCVNQTSTSNSNCQWEFYQGRKWIEPKFDSEDKCKLCSLPGKEYLSTDQCNHGYCDNFCRTCQPKNDKFAVKICVESFQDNCTSVDLTQYDDMREMFNITTDSACVSRILDSQANKCELSGGSVVSCDYFPADSCSNNPFEEYLKCRKGWKSCPTEKTCKSQGKCSDRKYIEEDIGGTCLIKGEYKYGGFSCSGPWPESYGEVRKTDFGCLTDSLDSGTCESEGGKYISLASNENECTSFKGCCEKGDCREISDLTPKNETECTKCGGEMKSYFEWKGAQWIQPQMKPLKWMTRGAIEKNKWVEEVDWGQVKLHVHRAVSNIISEALKKEARCKNEPIFNYLKNFACFCGTNSDDRCQFEDTSKSTVAGETVNCAANVIESSFGGLKWKIPIQNQTSCEITYSVNRIEPQPDMNKNIGQFARKRSYIPLRKRSSSDASCYAYIQNSQDAYIGQILGDCIEFSSSEQFSNVGICVSVSSAIPRDESVYSVDGIAQRTESEGVVKYTAKNFDEFTVNGDQFCFKISSSGTYCPVGLTTDWSSKSSASQPTCDSGQKAYAEIETEQAGLVSTATKVVFVKQTDASIKAGEYFSNVTAEFRDENDVLVTDATAAITISIKPGTGTSGAATLGTSKVFASSGVAVFNQISVDKVGTGYRLMASSGSLQVDYSNEFSVEVGEATGLKFTQQPGACIFNQTCQLSPIVEVVDSLGNRVSSSEQITLSAFIGATQVPLLGTITVQASNGVAEFDSFKIENTRYDVQLIATPEGALSSATSELFDVVEPDGYPIKIEFEYSPSGASAGQNFLLQPVVILRDANGQKVDNPAKNYVISVSLKDSSNPNQASLLGTTSISSIGGRAQFTDLGVDRAGKDLVLIAEANGLISAESLEFSVDGLDKLAFASSPDSEIKSGASFDVEILLYGIANNQLFGSNDLVELRIRPGTGNGFAGLNGTTKVESKNGVAKFTGLSISTGGAGYELMALSQGQNVVATSSGFTVSEDTQNATNDDDNSSDDILTRISSKIGLHPMIIVGIVAGCVLLMSISAVAVLRSKTKRELETLQMKQNSKSNISSRNNVNRSFNHV